jgi:hypothetical protein
MKPNDLPAPAGYTAPPLDREQTRDFATATFAMG